MKRREFLFHAVALSAGGILAPGCVRLGGGQTVGAASLDAALMGEIATGVTPNLNMAVSRSGKSVYTFCGGTVSPDSAEPVTRETLFNIGSVSKPVMGALLALLANAGEIDPARPVKYYLPEYADDADTILQVATHTTGYDSKDKVAWPTGESDFEDYRARVFAPRQRITEPNTTAAYISSGYFVLMTLVERVSGMAVEDFARRELFDPLGMGRTTYLWRRAEELGRVLPWIADPGRFQTEIAEVPPMGETGLWTTAGDLVRFGEMLLPGTRSARRRPLSEAALNLMLKDQTPAGLRRSMGFWMRPLEGQPAPFGTRHSPLAVGHPGYTGCMLSVDPQSETVIAIVTNSLKLQSDFTNYTRLNDLVLGGSGRG